MDPLTPASPATGEFSDVLIAAVSLFLYFFPAVVASVRQHARVNQITLMNVLFGWTGIGWAIALRMALDKSKGDKSKGDKSKEQKPEPGNPPSAPTPS